MTPSIELRLKTMTKAMAEVILPAIEPGNGLAREQAQLMIAQLGMIGQHWQKAATLDAIELREIADLAQKLAATAAGGAQTLAAADALTELLRQRESAEGSVAEERVAIAAAIDRLIRASGIDGSEAFKKASSDLILDHAAQQAWRDRVWFAGCGMDPERADLPSIDAMLAASAAR